MYLSHLSLTNFRNFSRLELDLAEGITLLQGLNAQGKTSFLEAVAYLSTSRSLLAGAERELVHWLAWEEPLPFARLVGEMVAAGGRKQKIEITLVQSSKSNAGAPLLRKEVRVNGVSRRAIDLIGQMPTVAVPAPGRRADLRLAQCAPALPGHRSVPDAARLLPQLERL